MIDPAILRRIQANDPDGFEKEPTDKDRRKFEEWVISKYGLQVLYHYRRA